MSTSEWRVLRAKNYGTVGRTVHAHLRYGGGVVVNELWLDPPNREREERDGAPMFIASETENFRFPTDSEAVRTDLTRGRIAMMWAGPHHSRLLGAHRRWPWDDDPRGGMSLGEPTSITAVEHAGRAGWQVTFSGGSHRGAREETFVLDDESGLAVRWTDGSDEVEIVSFVFDEVFDDSVFTWSGSWITHDDEMAEAMRRNAELQEKIADIPLSRPTWMPSKIAVTATDGDPTTEALDMSVSVTAPHVTLRRWLTQLPEPDSQSTRWTPEHHSVSDGTWTHELRWQTDALTTEDAERILRSIPPVGGEVDAAGIVARITKEANRDAADSNSSSHGTGDDAVDLGVGRVLETYVGDEYSSSLLIRTDFTDDAAWRRLVQDAMRPVSSGVTENVDFAADLVCVDNSVYDGLSVEELLERVGDGPPFYVFIADARAMSHSDQQILAVDTGREEFGAERGATVRVVPEVMWSIESNLSLGNMDFRDFIDSADDAGVFRGFES